MILSGLEWRMLMNFGAEKCEPIIIATSYAFTQRNDFIPVCVCVCVCVCMWVCVSVCMCGVCVWGRGGWGNRKNNQKSGFTKPIQENSPTIILKLAHTTLAHTSTHTHSQKFITKLIASIDNCNNLNFKYFCRVKVMLNILHTVFLSYWTLVMDFVAFRGIWESISRASQTTRIPVYNHHLCLLDTNNIITPCSFSKSKTCSTALEKNITKQNKARLSRDGLSFVDLTTLNWNFDCQIFKCTFELAIMYFSNQTTVFPRWIKCSLAIT